MGFGIWDWDLGLGWDLGFGIWDGIWDGIGRGILPFPFKWAAMKYNYH